MMQRSVSQFCCPFLWGGRKIFGTRLYALLRRYGHGPTRIRPKMWAPHSLCAPFSANKRTV